MKNPSIFIAPRTSRLHLRGLMVTLLACLPLLAHSANLGDDEFPSFPYSQWQAVQKNCMNQIRQAEYQKALPICLSAADLTQNGPQADYALDLTNLVDVYAGLRQYQNALDTLKLALPLAEKYLGPKYPLLPSLRAKQSQLQFFLGDFVKIGQNRKDELEKAEKDALAMHGVTYHYDTATARANLASYYEQTNELNKALLLYQQVYELTLKKFEQESPNPIAARAHPLVLASRNHVAGMHTRLKQYSQAESIYLNNLKVLQGQSKTEASDQSIIITLTRLAALYREQGKNALAQNYQKQADALQTAAFNKIASKTGSGLNMQAGQAEKAGQYAQARQLYKEAYEVDAKTFGANNPMTAASLVNYAEFILRNPDGALSPAQARLAALKVYLQAEKEQKGAIAKLRQTLSEDDKTIIGLQNRLLKIQEKRKQLQTAVSAGQAQ